jgi:hypothetical protein
MELIDRYLQAVRFWLPKAQQDDIIAELSEDLHSQIEEKESELGRPPDESEVEAVLRRCGSPIVVASRYQPQTQLIGPVLFPIYKFVMKIVLLWVLIPVFIVIVGPATILPAASRWNALRETLSTLWTALFFAAAIITLVFATIEHSQARLHLFEKWSPRSLPPVAKEEKPPSRTQSVFELVCAVLGLVYLLAIPYSPFLVLGPFAAFLKPAPMWHSFYLPILLLAILGVAHQCLTLLRPQWTWLPLAARLLTTVLTLVLVNYIINAAAQTPNGEWHPYVVVANSVPLSLQQNRVAAIVNVSVLGCLVCTWLGLSIAGLIQTWQLLRYFRMSAPRNHEPAPFRAT